ncbi:hypothetical protein D9619_005986 [Psilocybe cf. subviscida]|uniref:PhoD-like phosphatase domain-containing protein n=1 Tax=Psilocybe cf. subviscida TaxID=2480587 RepID=A0A8H5BWW1_9AGAR|nr:hypothetical protein D9619_005986 [Psilocybe cf. subviscida]
MDVRGWHAQRRAEKEDEAYLRGYQQTGRHGEDVAPMNEAFIGGFRSGDPGMPPALPPKDYTHVPPPPPQAIITPSRLANMSAIERSKMLRIARMEPNLQFMCGPLLKYDTVDEDGVWHGAALIVTADAGSIYEPSPVLTYTWDPAAPIPQHTKRTNSFSDTESQATRSPRQSFSSSQHAANVFPSPTSHDNNYYPQAFAKTPPNTGSYGEFTAPRPGGLGQLHTAPSYELGPHPADPHAMVMPTSPNGTNGFTNGGVSPGMPMPNMPSQSSNVFSQRAQGQELWVYGGYGGTFTFWRFLIKIPLADHEMCVNYSVNNGQQIEFWVPGRNQNMRWAAHSCNGFSAGVNPDDFRGPGFKSGYDPVWMDLLSKHSETPFHALVGGGDQLYCDSLMREPEMQEWVSKTKPGDKKNFPLSREMELAIDRFFFNHYCQSFRRGAFARANCSIPMINMCDDHGTPTWYVPTNYAIISILICHRLMGSEVSEDPDDLQKAPVFRQIGARGYFFFLLFQCFINVEKDGVNDAPGRHVYKSVVIGEMGPYVGFPSHSFLPRLGPKVYLLMLDCRAERKKDQVCSPSQYKRVFDRVNALPIGVEHLVVQIGIPIAYPRMVFLETALESKFNPLVALGRTGTMGLSGFVNKFNAEAELLDDLNDHWTARGHKKERNWLIVQLQNLAKIKRVRVTFVSGDVHVAAIGVLKSLKAKNKPEVLPGLDYRYMVNIVTSAIVNTPPYVQIVTIEREKEKFISNLSSSPAGVITMVSTLATKNHKTLHDCDTDESMVPIFTKEPSGENRKQKYVMGRRNWCRVEWDARNGEMIFDIRVEREKGGGVTTGYPMRVPPPQW